MPVSTDDTTDQVPTRPGPGYDARLLYASPAYFEAEMATLAESCWQFVGTTDELAENNAWVRARVWGADVFVQNFRGELRGFSNICRHRGFPIRRAADGRGLPTCGFHAWTYDADGVPIGIPRNEELFSFSRQDKGDFALPRIRVASIGKFVFAAMSDDVPPLDRYLGRYATLLATISTRLGARRQRATAEPRANWKLCYEVTLDEYHVQFVHPESFRAEPIPVWGCVYERDGAHSQLLRRRTADWTFADFWSDAGRGEYEFAGYKIHHVFPNLLVAVARGLIVVTTFVPRAFDETTTEYRMFEVGDDRYDSDWWKSAIETDVQISGEDRDVAEAQQGVMAQVTRPPVFGALEKRVGWFHDAYEALIGSRARQRITG